MRVVHVVTQTGTYGGERFVPALVRAQREAGLDASIVTIYDSPEIDGAVQVSCGRRGHDAKGGGFLFFFRLVSELRRCRPDVVHTHLAHAKLWGRLAAVVAGAKHIVHTEHGNAFADGLPRRTLTRLLHARTAAVVALTQAQARAIVRNEHVARERIAVIPNGIELRPPSAERAALRERLGLTSGDRLVLFVGRLDAVKRPLLAVVAFHALRDERARLWFAGGGTLAEAVAARARELGIAERVRLLGYRSDVEDLVVAADAVLNTSSSEAMPLSLIEALCLQTPVVTAPWPGADELGSGATVSAEDTPAAIARALKQTISCERPTKAASDRFSIDRAARAYAQLYESLDGERSPVTAPG